MNTRRLQCLTTLTLLATLAITLQLSAQDKPQTRHGHQNYTVVDVGTFGGPNAYIFNGPPNFGFLNGSGITVGHAGTTISDPYPVCWNGDCVVYHAFRYDDGRLRDLGALPGTNSSVGIGINSLGLIAGISENSQVDPLTGYPETRAVVWNGRNITNLGTLGGNISVPASINDLGQVAGASANSIPDDYASALGPCATYNCWPVATQLRAFLWTGGIMRDLGTLGGNDSSASIINDRGQVTGVSYTNNTPNATTGIPTQDPFFWENGRMQDIGTLGGTIGYPWWMNGNGQVVGQSNLVGDVYQHPFLWARGKLTDLGTLGGHRGAAYWINEAGVATGPSDITGNSAFHATLWKDGRVIDLGALPGYPLSSGFSINLQEQVVGFVATSDFSVFHAALLEHGNVIDLNNYVPQGSGITLRVAYVINDDGEIVAEGTDANGDNRVYLLLACGD